MKSLSVTKSEISLPLITVKESMIPFNLTTLSGLTDDFKVIVQAMLKGIEWLNGTAYFTLHGRPLKAGETLRRGGPHTDGNYEQYCMSFDNTPGRGGWKVGENGPPVGSETHRRQYIKPTGGIILTSNYMACKGWHGEFNDLPNVGGDCSHMELNEPFFLKENTVYYGNNHFIHESLAVTSDVHRVFARITLPEDHVFQENER